jgi:hypothetical protein
MTEKICPVMSAGSHVSACRHDCVFYDEKRQCWILALCKNLDNPIQVRGSY